LVPGSARPACLVGGLSQARVGSLDVGGPTCPPQPPTLGAPRETWGLLDHPRVASVDVGGPDMAPLYARKRHGRLGGSA